MADKAFLTVLSGKVRDRELLILDELKLTAPKTKEMAQIMKISPQIKKGILALSEKNENAKRAINNLPNLNVIGIDNINILDVLRYKYLIFTKNSLEYLNKKYSK